MPISWTCLPFADLGVDALYDCLALRDAVFVVEQDSVYGDVDGLDRVALHLLGRNDEGELVAYARLLPPGSKRATEVAIGRVVITPTARGCGLGKVLLAEAVAATRSRWPGVPLWLSAQVDKLGLYACFGFVAEGEAYDDGGILHRDMRAPG